MENRVNSWMKLVGAGYPAEWNPNTFRKKHNVGFLNWLERKGIDKEIALKDYRKMDDKEKEMHSKLVVTYERTFKESAFLSEELNFHEQKPNYHGKRKFVEDSTEWEKKHLGH